MPPVKVGTSAGCPGAEPSEFERRRLLHVKRAAEYLDILGLLACRSSSEKNTCLNVPERLRHPKAGSRSGNEGALGEQELPPLKKPRITVEGGGGGSKQRRSKQAGEDDCELNEKTAEADEKQVIEASRQWLRESRAVFLKPGLGGPAPDTPEAWRKEAVRRWGDAVPAEGQISDWKQFVCSRLPTPPPPSSFDFMQERYAADPWRLLAACALMTRISSERVKEDAVSEFFAVCPTPSAFLVRKEKQKEELARVLRPLGMVDGRLKTITELSHNFLEMLRFDCGHQKGVNKIWGCGPFSVDSYHLFCRGCRDIVTSDATCQAYIDWWREAEKEVPAPEERQVSNDLALPQKQQSNLRRFFKAAG